MTSQVREQYLCIIRPQLQAVVGSLEHKFVMADAKNLHFEVQYFQLEGAKVHLSDRNRYVVAKRGE